MLTIYPDYYKQFTCIADTCPITCCQEWKIYVDDATKKKWKTLSAPDSMDTDGRKLSSYITKKEGEDVIRLLPDQRCPFLTENKLCCLVQTYGDSVLSETCTLFPREQHTFSTHKEASLMPCCPAVIDLWQQDDTLGFPSYPMLSREILSRSTAQTQAAFLLRDHLIRLFSDTNLTPEEALLTAFYFLQLLLREEENGKTLTTALIEGYFQKENLQQLLQAIHEMPCVISDLLYECNELLQDLSVNYLQEGLYTAYLSPLMEQAERLTQLFQEAPGVDARMASLWEDFMHSFSTYHPLLKKYLANDIYADLLIDEDLSLSHMLMRLEWTTLQYTAIRHSLFLQYQAQDIPALSYETVRESLVILTRMTGYEEEDIISYLESSFESLLWDFGYPALIVGQ